ncbi:MAG: Ig-like domain-containing protein, partial [Dehalococcoidia bacterium]
MIQIEGPVPRYSISGRVTDDAGNPLADVTVSTSGPADRSTTTQSDGTYVLSSLPAGTYTVNASKAGYLFSPTSHIVSVPPDATDQDFIGTPTTDAAADPVNSSMAVSPNSAPADGTSEVQIIVTLRDSDNAPVSGKRVEVFSDRGSDDIIQQPAMSTDTNGQTVATIRSLVPGTATLSVWDVTDGFRLPQTENATFTDLAPVPQALLQKADLVTAAASRSVDRILNDATAVVGEAVYFRGAIGEQAIRLTADLLQGVLDVWEGASSFRNAEVAARIGFPGYRQFWLDTPAFASPAICKFSSAFLKDVTDQHRLLRLVGRGFIYFAAAQFNNECLSDLKFDFLADGVVIGNLLTAHLEAPAAEWPIRKMADDAQTILQASRSHLDKVRLGPMTQDEQQAYAEGLNLRARALFSFENRVRYARWTLEAVHQANEADPAGGHRLQMAARLGAKGLATYAFDGAGKATVGSVLTLFDTYMNTKALTESMKMFLLAGGTLAKTAPEALNNVANNTADGLNQIASGEPPPIIPRGQILSVRHVVEYGLFGSFGSPEKAYSDIHIKNTGDTPAVFHIWAAYQARVTRLTVPWATLSLIDEGVPVELGQNEEATVRIVYLDGNNGYLPAGRYSLPLGIGGEVPPTDVSIDLLGVRDENSYHLDHHNSLWMPERQPSGGDVAALVTSDAIGEGQDLRALNEDIPLIDTPLIGFVLGGDRPPGLQGRLWVNNPFTTTVPVTVTQTLPADMTVLDPGGGSVQGNAIVWTGSVEALDTLGLNFTFTYDVPPGVDGTLPGATLALQSPADGVLTTTSEPVHFQSPWSLSLTRHTPGWVAPDVSPTVAVTVTNQLTTTLSGSLTISATTTAGDSVAVIPQTFDLAGEATQRLDFTLPDNLARGDYLVTGLVQAQGGEAQAFVDPLTVGVPAPMLSYAVAPKGIAHPGELLTYTMGFTNTSGLAFSNVVITASLPVSLTLVSGSIAGGGSLQGDHIRWDVGNVADGAAANLGFQAEAGAVPSGLSVFPVDSQAYFTATETGISTTSVRTLLSRCGALFGDV